MRAVFQRQLEERGRQVAAQQGLQLKYRPEVLDFLVSKVCPDAAMHVPAKLVAVCLLQLTHRPEVPAFLMFKLCPDAAMHVPAKLAVC